MDILLLLLNPPPGDGPNCHLLIWNDKFDGNPAYPNAEPHPFAVCYIEYDMYTVPLYARSKVIPGEWYHIKLGVSDILTSGNWDSGVFLEAHFDIGQLTSSITDEAEFTDKLIQGCNAGTYTIKLGSAVDEDLEIPLSYGGDAVQGVDIAVLPTSITIPKGYNTASMPIEVITDDIPSSQITGYQKTFYSL